MNFLSSVEVGEIITRHHVIFPEGEVTARRVHGAGRRVRQAPPHVFIAASSGLWRTDRTRPPSDNNRQNEPQYQPTLPHYRPSPVKLYQRKRSNHIMLAGIFMVTVLG